VRSWGDRVITFGEADITRWLGDFFWPFLRTLALFAAAPPFNAIAIPARAKIALAIIIACLLGTTIKHSEPLLLSWASVALAAEQILIGLAIGFAMQLTLAAIAFAGDFIGIQMGFGFAGLFDVQSRFEVPVMADFFGLVGLLLFISLNGHLVLLGVLVKSFEVVPVVPVAHGSGITAAGWEVLARTGAALFQIGVWLALPVVAVLSAVQLALALISRVTPQINLMSVGFSVLMWVGLAATIALLPFLAPAVEHIIETALAVVITALNGK
jgi:flagellar biosynthetic protein FliR